MNPIETIQEWVRNHYGIDLTEEDAIEAFFFYVYELETQFKTAKQYRLFDKAFKKYCAARFDQIIEFSSN